MPRAPCTNARRKSARFDSSSSSVLLCHSMCLGCVRARGRTFWRTCRVRGASCWPRRATSPSTVRAWTVPITVSLVAHSGWCAVWWLAQTAMRSGCTWRERALARWPSSRLCRSAVRSGFHSWAFAQLCDVCLQASSASRWISWLWLCAPPTQRPWPSTRSGEPRWVGAVVFESALDLTGPDRIWL